MLQSKICYNSLYIHHLISPRQARLAFGMILMGCFFAIVVFLADADVTLADLTIVIIVPVATPSSTSPENKQFIRSWFIKP